MRIISLLSLYNKNYVNQPLIPGIGGFIADQIIDTALLVGLQTKDLPVVSANYINVYKHLAMRYVGTAPARLSFSMIIGGVEYEIFAQTPPVTNVLYDRQGEWALAEGDNLRVTIANATAGNDIYIYATGYKMQIRGSANA